MAAPSFFARLIGGSAERDGQAHALETLAERSLPSFAPADTARADARAGIAEGLAVKLLGGCFENRHQTLMPHTLNFGVLPREHAELLILVMAAAAQADGQIDPSEERQIPIALERVGAGEAEAGRLREAFATPHPLGPLLAQVHAAGLGAHAYAAALLAINRSNRVNQLFLDYLAARLALAPDVAESLESRYRT